MIRRWRNMSGKVRYMAVFTGRKRESKIDKQLRLGYDEIYH
jgi:hypothetical protein